MSKILDINDELLSRVAKHRIENRINIEQQTYEWLMLEIRKETLALLELTEDEYKSIYHGYMCELLGVHERNIIIKDDLQGFEINWIYEMEAFLSLNSPTCNGLYTLQDALNLSEPQLKELRTKHVIHNNLTLNEVYALHGEPFTIEDGISVFRAFALDKIYPAWEVKKYKAA
jgi:hypothetical protein